MPRYPSLSALLFLPLVPMAVLIGLICAELIR